jgi:phenylalanyl-tRNA synthetase beta chain
VNVSVNWLSAMLGRTLDPEDAAARLTGLGATVEAVEHMHAELGDVVIGIVERVERHPNADRLSLCRVNAGNGTVEVVCGAPNVRAGAKYPYAPAGAVLPGGFKLSARKIRGVTSNGMLCSARELGLGTEHEGILEVQTDAAPGTPFVQAMPVADVCFDVEVTANRPDLLCHKGVARELAAVYGLPVKLPAIPNAPTGVGAPRRVEGQGAVDGVEVVIEDVEGCPRYMAALIRGVEIGPSPVWLEARLRSIGARPINNVVDATNYVLYELNQPMHAFDVAKVRGGKIIVRRAIAGERLTTLDGEKRELTPDMTMICDAKGVTAIAGVMGGADSEVTSETTDVLLECAYFDPRSIRRTRQALKMTTEASYRFERGIDLEGMAEAIRRAVTLIRAIAGGEEPEPAIDVYPKLRKARSVFLRPERVEHVLGMPMSRDEIEGLLVKLGFPVAPKDDRLHVQVPGWRPDVTREIDLIEELARLKGYDSFPVELRPLRPSVVPNDPVEPVKARVRRVLTGWGLNEARSLSLTSAAGSDAVRVLNPLSAEDAYLRRDLLSGLVRSVERNWAVRERDVRLFELGTVFRASGAPLPEETHRLAAVISGARLPPHWGGAGKTIDYDLWDLKGLFVEAVRLVGGEGEIVSSDEGWEFRDPSGRLTGHAGPVDADRPAWAAPLYGLELDLVLPERRFVWYGSLPTTPPVERDVALVLPAEVSAAQVESVVRDAGGALLAEVRAFDEYRAEGMAGRSVAWRLVFRAPDRTLRDQEADEALSRVLAAVKERLGVERRQA